jgi:branched-chain amino acid transport system substrate-binding protein
LLSTRDGRLKRSSRPISLAWLLVPCARAQISDNTVKIGVLADMSGLYSDLSGIGSVVATQMAVEDFGRTLPGKKIEVVSADHQNKPDIGANVARQWIDQHGVDVIVDVPVSSVAFAVQQIAKERNRALLISSSGSSDLTGKSCSPTSVHWTYDTYALAQTAGKAMMQQGGDSWFFITADYASVMPWSGTRPQLLKRMVARCWEPSGTRRIRQIFRRFFSGRSPRKQR